MEKTQDNQTKAAEIFRNIGKDVAVQAQEIRPETLRGLLKKAHLLRCARPSSLRSIHIYTSFLRARGPCIWTSRIKYGTSF